MYCKLSLKEGKDFLYKAKEIQRLGAAVVVWHLTKKAKPRHTNVK